MKIEFYPDMYLLNLALCRWAFQKVMG